MVPRILILDESQHLASSIRDLSRLELDLVHEADVARALDYLEGSCFDLILCEPARRDGRGLELLEQVRRRARRTPLIVVTRRREPGFLADCTSAAEPFRFGFLPLGSAPLGDLLDAGLARARAIREVGIPTATSGEATTGVGEEEPDLERLLLEQVERLHILHRFSLELNQACGLDCIARLAARAAYQLLGGHGVQVQLWDPASREGVVRADMGPEMSSDLHVLKLSTSRGEVGELIVDRRCRTAGPGERAPRSDRELCDDAIERLTLITGPTGVAVANELRERERDEAQQATIMALVQLAESRDNDTGNHIERVARYCELVALSLRSHGPLGYRKAITDSFVQQLVQSAPLHDIGKVGIPDSILLKPGKLSPGEWEIMKTHAEIGERTLDQVLRNTRSPEYLEMGRDIAGGHHERWDGNGYPRGIGGEEIPLPARILALADIYDALTTSRPYKDAWSHSSAVEHLRGLAGNHLDPEVVEAFLRVADKADRIRFELGDGQAAATASASATSA